MRKFIICFLILYLFSNKYVFSQPYYFWHYQVESGLSNNAVLCILQDHSGFMWFGTRDGLNRFDGVSYKIFKTDPSNVYSIGNNAIMSLAEDDDHKIWIGTEKGLFIFDRQTERFVQLKQAGDGSVLSVKAIGDNVYYIALYTLYRYNRKNKVVTTFSVNKEITAYTVLPDNSIWICTSSGNILKYNPERKIFDASYDIFKKSQKAVSKWVQSIYAVGSGLFLVGTSNQGLKLLDSKTGDYKDILTLNRDKTDIIVRDIISIKKNIYWIATQSGIYILNIASKTYDNIKKDYDDPYSLSDNIVHSLYLDKQGGIWAGTYFGGVNYLPKQEIIFRKYFTKTNANSISGNAISEIREDKYGMLWIGTEDAGLNKFNPVTKQFENFNPTINRHSISYSNIHSLLTSDDTVWVGTYLHGLDILNNKGNKLYNYNTSNSSIGSNFICAILKSKNGLIYVATDKGIYRYISNKKDFILVDALPKVFYRTLYEDRNGDIWAGTYGDGVYVYNSIKNYAKHFYFTINKNPKIGSNIVSYIYDSQDSKMWFATEGGLCCYNTSNESLKIFTTANGLPSDIIYAILEDKHHNLWISTPKGLARFNPFTKDIKIFNTSQGLLTNQFNYRSAFNDDLGNMYFGSVKGMISFNPDSIITSNFVPPIYITGFQVYNHELPIKKDHSPLHQSITFTKGISLPYNQSTFSIDFAALDFSASPSLAYAYKLEGLDKNWTYLPTNRKVYFTELAPGNYSFLVKALNNTNKNDNYTRLHIEILPPFWQTWWAYTLYVLFLLLISYFIIRFFTDRMAAKNQHRLEKLAYEKEKENYEDKINFFINVAHEIKTPLTLIRGPMENLMDELHHTPSVKNSLSLMNRNTERLMQLANQLLDFRKLEMKGFALSPKNINVGALAYDEFTRFKTMAEQKNIKDIRFIYKEPVWAYADEEAMHKIFSNLMDNAFKYASQKVYVTIAYETDRNFYKAIFANDGFIIPPESKEVIFKSFYRMKETANHAGTGIGLALSRSLAEIQGGTLTLREDVTDMNIFELRLPVHIIEIANA